MFTPISTHPDVNSRKQTINGVWHLLNTGEGAAFAQSTVHDI